jgi:hypothetical protein
MSDVSQWLDSLVEAVVETAICVDDLQAAEPLHRTAIGLTVIGICDRATGNFLASPLSCDTR